MTEKTIMQAVVSVTVLGIVTYAVVLLMPNKNYRTDFLSAAEQDSTTIQVPIDTMQVRTANTYTYIFPDGKPTPTPATEIVIPSTTVVMDSDSVTQYNLYRKGTEAVHIDLEEHEEPIYFTWDDFSTWWRILTNEVVRLWNRCWGIEDDELIIDD